MEQIVERSLRFLPTPISGAVVIDSILRNDDRGHFLRAWCIKEFSEAGINFVPVQANIGFSRLKGTTRGMHFQASPALEAKVVRCTMGSAFDVVLDLRENSPTRYQWYGVELRADDYRMLYIPEGCAHGYQTLEDDSDLYYMTSQYFTPSAAKGVRFDDPAFGIDWPLTPTAMSELDRTWPLIGEGSSR
jgi:dTDP-4-dehydrorhamnose 3,5-epimerase